MRSGGRIRSAVVRQVRAHTGVRLVRSGNLADRVHVGIRENGDRTVVVGARRTGRRDVRNGRIADRKDARAFGRRRPISARVAGGNPNLISGAVGERSGIPSVRTVIRRRTRNFRGSSPVTG